MDQPRSQADTQPASVVLQACRKLSPRHRLKLATRIRGTLGLAVGGTYSNPSSQQMIPGLQITEPSLDS